MNALNADILVADGNYAKVEEYINDYLHLLKTAGMIASYNVTGEHGD